MIKGGVFMVIELKNIEKFYGEKEILKIDNLKIEENEKVGIIGRNGSGKTTLCNIIAKKIKADKGEVRVYQNINYIEQFIKENDKEKSGGEKQIENWKHNFFKSNGILIADEPTSNLDIEHIEELKENLIKYKRNNITNISR